MIATDLGKPCTHDYQFYPRVRFWGCYYPARPCINGTCCLSGGDGSYYAEKHRPRIRRLAKAQPEVAEEFHAWLMQGEEKDRSYLQQFFQRLDQFESEP